MLRRFFAIALLLLPAATGCRPTPPSPSTSVGIALRWIEDESSESPTWDRIFDTREVFVWRLSTLEDVGVWRLGDATARAVSRDRVLLTPTGPEPVLERAVALEPDQVDRIEVRVAGLQARTVTLWWAGPLQRFSAERSITAELRPADAERGRVARLELAGHRWWTDRVTRLRVDPFGADAAPAEVLSITGFRRVADGTRVAAAVARPWKVELESDARNALLAAPGVASERRLTVPEDAVLRFGYGLQHGVREPIRFEVEVVSEDGKARSVFWDRLDPLRGEGRIWSTASVSLAGFAGRRVGVRLLTAAGPDFEPFHGLPVWANPEILGGPPPELPNVVLICLDTLRADRLSSYGHRLPTSPHLDAWAADRAARFSAVVATSPWTLPSHVSMFTGLDAVRHGVNHYGAMPPHLDAVAESLRRAGYATGAVTGGGYLRPQFGFTQGFDRFAYWPHEKSEVELERGMELASAWIEEHRLQPFFLFFHTYEVHYPHRRRQPYFDRLAEIAGVDDLQINIQMRSHGWDGLVAQGDYFVVTRNGSQEWQTPLHDDEKVLVNLMYDSSVSYADAQIQRLLDLLDRHALTERTVVVVTSDHGEALGEDDRAGHSYLEDYNSMVPLMIALPGRVGAGTVIDRQVRLTDLTPTLLDAAGLPPPDGLDGVSLLPLMRGEPTEVPSQAWTYSSANNRGIAVRVDNQLKYVLSNAAWAEIAGAQSLFDLTTDPAERVDLSSSSERVSELRQLTVDTLLAQHAGFRLTLRNAGPLPLEGQLEGALASHARVKTADPDCGCIHWRPGEYPTFALAPGQRVRLLVEAPEWSFMGLAVWRSTADGTRIDEFRRQWSLDDVADPEAWSLTASGWREIPDPVEPPRIGFRLWLEGGTTGSVTAQPDDTALEQLRALGYVQ